MGKAIEYVWKYCPKCGKFDGVDTLTSVKYCGYCGTKLVTGKKVVCPKCGEDYPASDEFKYCLRCGKLNIKSNLV